MKKTLTTATLSLALVLGLASSSLALHETEIALAPIVVKEPRPINLDGVIRVRGFYGQDTYNKDSAGLSGYDSRVQLGVSGMTKDPRHPSGYVKLEPGNTLTTWNKGYWRDGGNMLHSSPFAAGRSIWYVDGKMASNGWSLTFTTNPSRNPIDWYQKKQIINGTNATNGYPGDIMILDLGSTGHAAVVTGKGYWNGMRAWKVRHANWTDPNHTGQTWVESPQNVRVDQCTFVEYRPGKVKVLYNKTSLNEKALARPSYNLVGFIHKK